MGRSPLVGRAVVASGLALALGACAHDAEVGMGECGRTKVSRDPLMADPQGYIGDDLGAKELALTFDDGPGPMSVSGALAEWLNARPTPIQVTFFVNGACVQKTPLSSSSKNASCGDPIPDADDVLAKEAAEGHYVGNHTTTHRDLVTEVLLGDGAAGVVAELTETDGLIAKHQLWNRQFFRAPYGSYSQGVFNALKNSPMNKYAGPVYWNQGGGPTNGTRAADWECWQTKKITTKACGDLYLTEIAALGNKGIVLLHDATGNTANHDIDNGIGNTFDMVKYIVPKLEAAGFKFKRLDEVPAIAAVLPKCDASCVECKGPAATDCTTCSPDKHVDNGACVAGAPVSDAGVDASSNADAGITAAPDAGPSPSGPSDARPADVVPPKDAGEPSKVAAKHEDGCNAAGQSGSAFTFGWIVLATALLRAKRRAR